MGGVSRMGILKHMTVHHVVFEFRTSKYSFGPGRLLGPSYCISLFFQSRRELLEFKNFFDVSHAGESTGSSKTVRDQARHQSSDLGFLPAANQSASRAFVPLRIDLRHESVASKPHGAEQPGEPFERAHAP